MAAMGIELMSMKDSWPLANELIVALRPLINVSVELVPRPRNDTADAPTGVSPDNGPAVDVEKVPRPPPVMTSGVIVPPV